MGRFGRKFGSAAPTGKSGNYIVPGVALLEVESVIEKISENQNTKGDQLIIVEYVVRDFKGTKYHSYDKDELVSSEGRYQAGDKNSIVCNLDNEYGASNLKAALVPLYMLAEDCTQEEATRAMLDKDKSEGFLVECIDNGAVDSAQVLVEGINKATRKGSDFTRVSWTSCEQDSSTIAEARGQSA